MQEERFYRAGRRARRTLEFIATICTALFFSYLILHGTW
jgi:TRAP-type C4-dicarboxylate transport system permease small subunit